MPGENSNKSICAVVVSYNDPTCLLQTVRAICDQVEKTLVIDNGSSPENIEKLTRDLAELKCVELLLLEKNMGIGYALNIGFKKATQGGFQWLLTLDQDSIAEKNMVEKLYDCGIKNENSGIIFPSLNSSSKNFTRKYEHKAYAITSGNLVKIKTLSALNGFNEDYFIDGVDFDFCLRVTNSGFLVTKVNDAILKHRLGDKRVVNIFGIKLNYIEHSPLRRYYIFRNHLYLTKEYFFKNKVFIAKKNAIILIYIIQIILFDTNRLENIKMIGFGLLDFLRGKKGRWV